MNLHIEAFLNKLDGLLNNSREKMALRNNHNNNCGEVCSSESGMGAQWDSMIPRRQHSDVSDFDHRSFITVFFSYVFFLIF
jgi:hypothetical protein